MRIGTINGLVPDLKKAATEIILSPAKNATASAVLYSIRAKLNKLRSRGKRIVFIEPTHPNYSIHYCVVHDDSFLIQIDQFVEEILRGAELWLDAVQETETFKKNYENFARRHPNGLASVRGVPVVG